MTEPTCPQTAAVLALFSGQLPPDRAEAVEAHIDACPVCLARAAALPVENPLIREIRSGLPAAAPAPAELAPLIARLSSLYPTLAPSRSGAPPGGVDEIVRNLAPARAGDELGRLAHYRVLGVIGVGGMGVVFRAEDTTLGRNVALKVMRPRPGRDGAGKGFLREARMMAGVRHDHIVVVYQVGEEAGRDGSRVPFFAMELLTGEGADGWLRRAGRAPAAWVARIGRQAAAGLAAAHAAGLVHRDVKPANLWLESPPGWAEGADETRATLPAVARVKVLDFGLAVPRAEGGGEIIGTLAYMAPEQMIGAPADARSDLFGLGCVLYELCTGQLPYPERGGKRTQLPPLLPVRSLAPDVPPGMAALIDQMLAPAPADRPASARQVERELARFEAADPAPAPDAVVGPLRHRRPIVIGTAAAVLLVATAWAVAWGVSSFGRTSIEGVEKSRYEVPSVDQEVLQLGGVQDPVNDIAYLTGDRAVLSDSAGTLSVWDTATGRPLAKHVVARGTRLLSVAVSPDGSRAVIGRTRSALVYDLKTDTVTAELPHPDEVWQVAYMSGGATALTACLDGTARVWDLATGQVVRTFSCGRQAVWTAAVSPDGRWVATGGGGALRAQSWDHAVRIWDAGTGQKVHELTGHTGDVRQLMFTPDSKTVVSGAFDGTVRIWDAVAGKEQRTIQAHTAFVERVVVLPDGQRLLSVGGGQMQQDGQQVVSSDVAVRMWDIETGRPLKQWTGHRRGVRTLAVSPDGKHFLSGSDDRTVRLWEIP